MRINSIKIGLDFHGVINDKPTYFAEFSKKALLRGFEIHIITGGPEKKVKEILEKFGVVYTKIFAIVDYYDSFGEVEYFEDGSFKVEENLWNAAKSEYCSLNGINLHIDDSKKYTNWFVTPYCCYDNQGKKCMTENGFEVDFSKSADSALDKIEEIISSVQYF